MNRVIILLAVVMGITARADLRLPGIIGENMVLQHGRALPIWGWAEAGETVTVSFADQTQTAKAADDGAWRVQLAALHASAEPQTMRIVGSTSGEKVLANVLVGEVWLCSGQSNMQWPVGNSQNAKEEITNAEYPHIRLFTVPSVTSIDPVATHGGQWQPCTPQNVAGFSAVGYFFGRHLHQQLEVPIGLIDSSWGGTVAEAWTSAPALREALPEFEKPLTSLHEESALMDARRAKFREGMEAWQAALRKMTQLHKAETPDATFVAPDADTRDWKRMQLPAYWETQMPGLDGIVWFRKSIDIPPEWEGRELIMRPGPIDEIDITYFNGVRVGGEGSMQPRNVGFWNIPRDYRVPAELVKAGRNVIAIQVYDSMGQGGLWGGAPEEMIVVPADAPQSKPIPLAEEWQYKVELEMPTRPANPDSPNRPSVLYNAMIHPLIPFAIRGAIWYQGESNAGRAEQYRTLLPTLIGDWRQRWQQGDFPFLVVQLANFRAATEEPVEEGWALLREAQAMTAAADPQVGLAVAIDIGEAEDIHPRNKQDVGYRLALAAEAIAYQRPVVHSGPVFEGMRVSNGKAHLSFQHVADGLRLHGEKLTGFAIAGDDGIWHHADAVIDGNTVVLSAAQVETPQAVRYGWANNPPATLYNSEGLPAVPFRTDTDAAQ